ncbi:Cysteine synthase [Arthrobacter sp. PAMC 25486]|uniref:pyridoxal-phosphate dependent enzyme n=1 Tax=Arthrobacter sp. PAMC 25486 TaxID=1494608 RepID=UPI00053626A9|nr:pyridoxal-phosphate dependent enzyme [Arthrobacter sp. PAMC 25486]AIX99987.1 Cysteine synthase [Arthrobacter sp. PAMC 25486]
MLHSSGTLTPFVTPTVKLSRLFAPHAAHIYAKLDLLQLSGSTKERTARGLIEDLLDSGRLHTGGMIVESTSGNLGIALARQCVVRGLRFTAVVDENANPLALNLMRVYGATVELVATPADGNKLAARRRRVQDLLAEHPGSVTTNQYGSPANPRAHFASTMPEIMAGSGGDLDYLFIATSTTGTLLGCQQYIRAHGLDTKIVAVDSVGSVLFGGASGTRRLPGLGAGVLPELAAAAQPDLVFQIEEIEMVHGCRLLARREGILAGASTGAIVAAMGKLLPDLDSGARIAFMVHDTGVPYLPTVYDDDWVRATLGADPEPGFTADPVEVPHP